jgi:hypothetical protein
MRSLSSEKSRSLTFDAEIMLGRNSNGDIQTCTALLIYFDDPRIQSPIDGSLHFVSGKVAAMDSTLAVGKGFHRDNYDFVIDADIVCAFFVMCLSTFLIVCVFKMHPLPDHPDYLAVRPTFSVAGAVRTSFQ